MAGGRLRQPGEPPLRAPRRSVFGFALGVVVVLAVVAGLVWVVFLG